MLQQRQSIEARSQAASVADYARVLEVNEKPHPRLGGRGFVDQTMLSR